MAKKKVLLMGKAHSGKTSMRSIIFANYLARDTTRLSPTLDVEHHHVRFLGDLVLNLWDCGGQDAFYESYFERDRETIFRSVELLIYVFDIESETPEKDFNHFCGVLEAIEENSPDARVFILIHKMDLVALEDRGPILDDRKALIEESCESCGVEHYQCFGTSIWDETLYKAWSEIVTNLIPNISLLETQLIKFCRQCDADEVVLFERATFLVISHALNDGEDEYVQPLVVEAARVTASAGQPPLPIEPPSSSGVAATEEGLPLAEPPSASSLPRNEDGEALLEVSVDSSVVPASNTLAAAGGGDGTPASLDYVTESPSVTQDGAGTKDMVPSQTRTMRPQQPPVRRHQSRTPHFDAHRFEKISNIVKQFKLSCGKAQAQFQGMQVKNSRFSAYIDAFTANTYIMVIVSNPDVHSAATLLNIQNARNHFDRYIPRI